MRFFSDWRLALAAPLVIGININLKCQHYTVLSQKNQPFYLF